MSAAARVDTSPRYDRTDGHPFDKNELGVTIAFRGTGVLETFARDSVEYVLDAVAGRLRRKAVHSGCCNGGVDGNVPGRGFSSRRQCPAARNGGRHSGEQGAKSDGISAKKLPTCCSMLSFSLIPITTPRPTDRRAEAPATASPSMRGLSLRERPAPASRRHLASEGQLPRKLQSIRSRSCGARTSAIRPRLRVPDSDE